VGESKRVRLDEIKRELTAAQPFGSLDEARAALVRIMDTVEDRLSGVTKNPDSAESQITDGRMYPPDDRFETKQECPTVRLFKQRAHRTYFGENGSLKIVTADGSVELDFQGADGKSVSDLLMEYENERARKTV
jgi:hypothetical protein